MNNESNENGVGWIATAISTAVTITMSLIANSKAKKAQKKAQEEAAAANKINAFATLDNQYAAESNSANTRALIFGAVGVIGAYLLLKNNK